jgi:hypothetical protein
MIETFRFLSGKSNGASNAGEAQRYSYNALHDLVEFNEEIIYTTITPFDFHHNGRVFRLETISYYVNNTTNRKIFKALICHSRYICEISYQQTGMNA